MPYFDLKKKVGSEPGKIFYIDRGDGKEAVILVHGWYQNIRDGFRPYIDALQHSVKVYGIDLPGHGSSYKQEDADYSIEIAQAALKQMIEIARKNYSRVTVIGQSMGAYLALKTALEDQKIIDGLVLLSPLIDFKPHLDEIKKMSEMSNIKLKALMWYRAMKEKFPFGDRKQIYDPAKGHKYPSKTKHHKMKMKEHPLHAAKNYMLSFEKSELQGDIARLKVPVLLVYGSEDKLTPSETGTAMARKLPMGLLRIIPEAGHSVHITQKNEVLPIVQKFLEDNYKKRSAWRRLFSRS